MDGEHWIKEALLATMEWTCIFDDFFLLTCRCLHSLGHLTNIDLGFIQESKQGIVLVAVDRKQINRDVTFNTSFQM